MIEELTYSISTNNQEDKLLTELKFIQLNLSDICVDISILEDNHKIIFKTKENDFCEIITSKVNFNKKVPEKLKIKLSDNYEYYFKSSKSKINYFFEYIDFFNVSPIGEIIKMQHIFSNGDLILIEVTTFKKGVKIKTHKKYFEETTQLITETIFKRTL